MFDSKKDSVLQVHLNMRRGLDGRLMVFDHDHIDIVLLPEKNKVIVFAKQDYSDIIYETQDRLFKFLINKGICAPESVKGGNVYGSFEAEILPLKDKKIPIEHLFALNLQKWIKSELPALQMDKEYEKSFTDMLTEPDEEDSTELGEITQEEEKGSIPAKQGTRRYIGGWW